MSTNHDPGREGRQARLATFGDETLAALWQWLHKRGKDPGALFTRRLGNRLTPGRGNALLSRIGKRGGVTIRPHMFRHAWAHYNLAAGQQEGVLMELAGCSNASYLHHAYGASLRRERALAAGRAVQVGKILKGGQS